MTPRLTVESPQNPRVKELVRLKERRAREREGRFVIEGAREVRRALEAGVAIRELYVCPEFITAEGEAVLAHVSPERVVGLAQAAFLKASHREHPDGVLAVAEAREASLDALELSRDALVLVLDGLEKPGNLGALLRTADGAGLAAVFATGRGTDFYNPNVIRASMGSVFSRPVLQAESPALLAWLLARGFRTIAASPQAAATYWQESYLGRVALVLGTEGEGLSPFWERAARGRVKIPMLGLADSLNVATAGALIVYEALRQRQNS